MLVAAVGDLVLMRPLGRPGAGSLLQVLAGADLVLGNLEVPLTDAREAARGGLALRGDRALIADLAGAGFDAVSLANNHTGDMGGAALEAMAEDLRRAGVQPVGPGLEPVLVDGVALLAANFVGAGPELGERLCDAVRRARERTPAVLVLAHWGVPWSERVEAAQVELGAALAAAGATAVFGAHSHCVHGVQLAGGTPVFQGLGTFVFDYEGELAPRFARDAAVALVRLEAGRVAEARLLLGRLDEAGRPVRAHPERARHLAEALARHGLGWAAEARLDGDTLVLPCG